MKPSKWTSADVAALSGGKPPPPVKTPTRGKRTKRQREDGTEITSAGCSAGFNCTREELQARARLTLTTTRKGQGTIIELR
jgi:hypothetical protein